MRYSREVFDGDFILSNSMSFGRPYIMKTKGCIHDGWLMLRPKDKEINVDYFYTVLGADFIHKLFTRTAIGGVVDNLNINIVKQTKIPVPPLETQKIIVGILDDGQQQKQAKEAEAKELLASIDDYLLAELGITLAEQDNSLQKRIFTTNFSQLTGSRFDAYFYQEKFEYIYSVLSNGIFHCSTLLKESKLITSGATPLSGGDAYVSSGNGIPFIRSGEISNISFNECIYIKPEIHNTMLKSSKLKLGDLLIAIVGATIGEIGVYYSEREANINQAIALVRFKESINSTFIMEFIRSSFGQFILDRMKRPVARANINLDEIGTLPIPVPPLEKQQEIAEYIRSIRQKAKQLQEDGANILADAKMRVEQMILGKDNDKQ